MDGASVHNLNALLACGVGWVLVQTKVWKNLFLLLHIPSAFDDLVTWM
jgi:hypothetical protein